MPQEKLSIKRSTAAAGSIGLRNFCAAVVRQCNDMSVLASAFQSRAEPVSPSSPGNSTTPAAAQGAPSSLLVPVNSFDFVTGVILAMASLRLVPCIDAMSYRARVSKMRAALHSHHGANKLGLAPSASLGSFLRTAKGVDGGSSTTRLDSDEVFELQRTNTLTTSMDVAPAATRGGGGKRDKGTPAGIQDARDRRDAAQRLARWESEVREAFLASKVKLTDDEVEYFDSVGVMEWGLLQVFHRLDTAYAGTVTFTQLVSLLSECADSQPAGTDAAPAEAAAGGASHEHVLLEPEDRRHVELDTASSLCLWPERRLLCILSAEHHRQQVAFVESTNLVPWRRHVVHESVGKVLSVEVIAGYHGAVALTTYAGIRIHDAENWLCKAILPEKELVTCVRWLPAFKVLVAGNQVGAVIEYDLGDMDRIFLATRKPYTGASRKYRRLHTETVTDILRETPTNFVCSASMDGTIVMRHHDSGAVRIFRGSAVVGMCLAEHLGLVLAYGVDGVPFAFSFHVPDSAALPLGEAGTRGHPDRLIAVGLLDDENLAASVDRTGVVKVWDLIGNTCLHTCGVTDFLEGGKYLRFHAAIIGATGVDVIARRRRFVVPFNQRDFGRVPALAAQAGISCVTVDPLTLTVIAAIGMVVEWWAALTGRKLHRTTVTFLPPPAGTPHGSVADAVSSLVLSPDGRQLVVASDKYSYNVHCAVTGVCRSRHVIEAHVGPLLAITPMPVPDSPERPAEGFLVSTKNGNPRRAVHRAVHAAALGAAERAATGKHGGESAPYQSSANAGGGLGSGRGGGSTTEAFDSHVLERVVLSTTSELLRVRHAVHLRGLDLLVATEGTAASRTELQTECNTLAVWRRLPNGSWSRCGVGIDLPCGVVTMIPAADVAPAARHLAVVTRDELIRIVVVDLGDDGLPCGLVQMASFAHRSATSGAGDAFGAALSVQHPSALAWHPSHSRLLVVGDDAGDVGWYDVGDCLHRCRPPTPPPSSPGQSTPGGRRSSSSSSSASDAAASSVAADDANNEEHEAAERGRSPTPLPDVADEPARERCCADCGLAASSFPTGHAHAEATVWLVKRATRAHRDSVTGLSFVTLPEHMANQPLLLSAGHDGAVRLHLFDGRCVTGFVDLSKRIRGKPPRCTYEALQSDSSLGIATLPEHLATTACATEGHGDHDGYTRCSSAGVTHTKPPGAVAAGGSGPDAVGTSTQQPHDATGAHIPAAAAAGTDTFLTSIGLADDLHSPSSAPSGAPDDGSGLPPLRSSAGLGLSIEHRVAMYKEWVFEQQLKLASPKNMTRLERMQLLHAVHESSVEDCVDTLLAQDDTTFDSARRKRSPRQARRGESPDGDPTRVPDGRTAHDGRVLPSLTSLKRLARPGGRLRTNPADAAKGEDRFITMPPRGRERQLQVQREMDVAKAQHDFKARLTRTKEQREAAASTVQEMPHSDFVSQMRSAARAAASMEEEIAARRDELQRRRGLGGGAAEPSGGPDDGPASTDARLFPHDRTVSPVPGPTSLEGSNAPEDGVASPVFSREPRRSGTRRTKGGTSASAGDVLAPLRHARAAGGANQRQRVPRYVFRGGDTTAASPTERTTAHTPTPMQRQSMPQSVAGLRDTLQATTPPPLSSALIDQTKVAASAVLHRRGRRADL